MSQTPLFDAEKTADGVDAERVVLYALGDFQARGLALAGRDLPLDRLRGALRRAAEAFGVDELEDEQAAATLEYKFKFLGAVAARGERFYLFARLDPYEQTEERKKAEANPQTNAHAATANPSATPANARPRRVSAP